MLEYSERITMQTVQRNLADFQIKLAVLQESFDNIEVEGRDDSDSVVVKCNLNGKFTYIYITEDASHNPDLSNRILCALRDAEERVSRKVKRHINKLAAEYALPPNE